MALAARTAAAPLPERAAPTRSLDHSGLAGELFLHFGLLSVLTRRLDRVFPPRARFRGCTTFASGFLLVLPILQTASIRTLLPNCDDNVTEGCVEEL